MAVINIGKVLPEPHTLIINGQEYTVRKFPVGVILGIHKALLKLADGSTVLEGDAMEAVIEAASKVLLGCDAQFTPEWITNNFELQDILDLFTGILEAQNELQTSAKKKAIPSEVVQEQQTLI
jgi:hypothetical protein